MAELKLLALDGEDLGIISAHMQDAVFKVGDMSFDARAGQFSLAANRFDWERAQEKSAKNRFERHRAALVFKRVRGVRSQGIDRRSSDTVLSLLAIRYTPEGDGPEGLIELALSGSATLSLKVECIEAQLADIGGTWAAASKPQHPEDAA
jgi:hypothetical protein